MRELIEKYAVKMFRAGLAHYGAPLFGGLDADLVWNRPDPRCGELEAVIQGLSVNSLLFCRPAEPYASIVEFLARQALDEAGNQPAAIQPQDCETRTFLHDLPVIREFSVPDIIQNLKRRKTVIIPGEGIVTWGTVSPEQAYIFFSSACFACFVRFFSQYLTHYRRGTLTPEHLLVFERAMATLDTVPCPGGSIARSDDRTFRYRGRGLCRHRPGGPRHGGLPTGGFLLRECFLPLRQRALHQSDHRVA
jgi:hypothetical protein